MPPGVKPDSMLTRAMIAAQEEKAGSRPLSAWLLGREQQPVDPRMQALETSVALDAAAQGAPSQSARRPRAKSSKPASKSPAPEPLEQELAEEPPVSLESLAAITSAASSESRPRTRSVSAAHAKLSKMLAERPELAAALAETAGSAAEPSDLEASPLGGDSDDEAAAPSGVRYEGELLAATSPAASSRPASRPTRRSHSAVGQGESELVDSKLGLVVPPTPTAASTVADAPRGVADTAGLQEDLPAAAPAAQEQAEDEEEASEAAAPPAPQLQRTDESDQPPKPPQSRKRKREDVKAEAEPSGTPKGDVPKKAVPASKARRTEASAPPKSRKANAEGEKAAPSPKAEKDTPKAAARKGASGKAVKGRSGGSPGVPSSEATAGLNYHQRRTLALAAQKKQASAGLSYSKGKKLAVADKEALRKSKGRSASAAGSPAAKKRRTPGQAKAAPSKSGARKVSKTVTSRARQFLGKTGLKTSKQAKRDTEKSNAKASSASAKRAAATGRKLLRKKLPKKKATGKGAKPAAKAAKPKAMKSSASEAADKPSDELEKLLATLKKSGPFRCVFCRKRTDRLGRNNYCRHCHNEILIAHNAGKITTRGWKSVFEDKTMREFLIKESLRKRRQWHASS
eukprot:TRINITY_DN70572_c0_g1_i1.p1 TRINITY_DN70572_c0_g1~~TRINITY_DN70572_c0_g1_i1.p1  ORF type:complete len:629 (-),score=179.17 TRINITY_DN70572_c0_g1_i1:138-2024(-)